MEHHPEGIARLTEQLAALSPTPVVLEATGGLELPLEAELLTAQLPVVVVNPGQVMDFAKALGKLAKTDTLDARVLAQFGEATKPQLRPLADAQTSGAAGPGSQKAPAGGDAHCREEPAAYGHPKGPTATPGAHTVVGTAFGRVG